MEVAVLRQGGREETGHEQDSDGIVEPLWVWEKGFPSGQMQLERVERAGFHSQPSSTGRLCQTAGSGINRLKFGMNIQWDANWAAGWESGVQGDRETAGAQRLLHEHSWLFYLYFYMSYIVY